MTKPFVLNELFANVERLLKAKTRVIQQNDNLSVIIP